MTNHLDGLIQALTGDTRKFAVWAKGRIIPGYDPTEWRHDDYGHVIRYWDYGNRDSQYGWEIDHIHPFSLGGSEDISNLRPLHCKRNASLGGALSALLKS